MFQRLIHTLFGPRLGSPASLVLPRLWAAPPGAGDPLEARRGLATDDGVPGSGDGQSDSDKLHELVVEHGDAVYRLALSVVRDRALAEDVAQDTMIKAWLALPSFRG